MTEMKLSFTTYMQEPHLFNPEPFQNLRTMVNAISYKFVSTNRSTKSDGSFCIPVKKTRMRKQEIMSSKLLNYFIRTEKKILNA